MWYGGGKLAADLSLPKLRARLAPARAGAGPQPGPAGPDAAWDHAAGRRGAGRRQRPAGSAGTPGPRRRRHRLGRGRPAAGRRGRAGQPGPAPGRRRLRPGRPRPLGAGCRRRRRPGASCGPPPGWCRGRARRPGTGRWPASRSLIRLAVLIEAVGELAPGPAARSPRPPPRPPQPASSAPPPARPAGPAAAAARLAAADFPAGPVTRLPPRQAPGPRPARAPRPARRAAAGTQPVAGPAMPHDDLPSGFVWRRGGAAGVDDVDDGQRAAVVEVEQAERGWAGTTGRLCGSAARSEPVAGPTPPIRLRRRGRREPGRPALQAGQGSPGYPAPDDPAPADRPESAAAAPPDRVPARARCPRKGGRRGGRGRRGSPGCGAA